MAVGAMSCSDNQDTDLKPQLTDRTLEVKPVGEEITNNILDLGAGASTTEFEVTSNTRWAVEISDCEGGWCDVDVLNASGNGSFTIKVLDNMKEKRTCFITVYKTDAAGKKEIDGSKQLTVNQAVSDVLLTPSSLANFAATGNKQQELNIISNVAWTLDVTDGAGKSVNFITINPSKGSMTADGDGKFSGDGDATFYLTVDDNRTSTVRKAYLTLHSAVAEHRLEITQLESEYSFDVSPVETQNVGAEGGQIQFAVKSLSGWEVTSDSYIWITFSKSSFESSTDVVNVIATIAPNETGKPREGKIKFIPKDDKYPDQDVYVKQAGFDIIFSTILSDDGELVMESATSKYLKIGTSFEWEITIETAGTDRWLHASLEKGTGSKNITINIDSNTSNANRKGTITVTPLPTVFPGGVTLKPKDFDIHPAQYDIVQFGGREPAISVPWLGDGYGQTIATVEFNYYSPFYNVVASGLQWKKADSEAWETIPAEIKNPTEGVVSVNLSGLDPATQYVARGFVTYETEAGLKTAYGSASYPFTTAGHRPGADDNPTPKDR